MVYKDLGQHISVIFSDHIDRKPILKNQRAFPLWHDKSWILDQSTKRLPRAWLVALAFIAEEGERHRKKKLQPFRVLRPPNFGLDQLDIIGTRTIINKFNIIQFQYNCHNFWCVCFHVCFVLLPHFFGGGSMVHHVSPRKSRGHPLRRSAQRGWGRWMVSGTSFGHREATSKWGNLQQPHVVHVPEIARS